MFFRLRYADINSPGPFLLIPCVSPPRSPVFQRRPFDISYSSVFICLETLLPDSHYSTCQAPFSSYCFRFPLLVEIVRPNSPLRQFAANRSRHNLRIDCESFLPLRWLLYRLSFPSFLPAKEFECHVTSALYYPCTGFSLPTLSRVNDATRIGRGSLILGHVGACYQLSWTFSSDLAALGAIVESETF